MAPVGGEVAPCTQGADHEDLVASARDACRGRNTEFVLCMRCRVKLPL